ncbi:MAG: VRR-NUC domain-containing protein [Planctomycetota bacterium]
MATPEGEIVNAICEYLTLKRRFFYRHNQIPVFNKDRGTFRAMPKYSMRGVPDIICVKDGRYIGIEVKTEKGVLSEHQHEFGRGLMLAGGDYLVARSLDDVMGFGL